MTLYLDASVIVPLLFTERVSDVTRAWVADQTRDFHVGYLAVGEAASAISRRRRMNLLTVEQGERAFAALDAWLRASVRFADHDPVDIRLAAQWVRHPLPKLLMPDAIHLATCLRNGFTMVTGDRDLAIVAERLGVDCAAPA